MFVYALGDPDDPAFAGSVLAGSLVLDVELAGRFAYAADPLVGIEVIDLAGAPASIGPVAVTGEAVDLEIAGDRIVAATSEGVSLLSASDPQSPSEIFLLEVDGGASAIALQGSFGAAATNDSVVLFSLTQDGRLEETSRLTGARSSIDVAIEGHTLAVSDGRDVLLYDVSDPAMPAPTGSLVAEARVFDLCAANGSIAALTRSGLLASIDRTDPAEPRFADPLGVPSRVLGIDHLNGLVIAGDEERGVLVIDASAPHRPIVISTVPGLKNAGPVRVFGDRAVVIADAQLVAIDLSVPEAPGMLASVPVPPSSLAIEAIRDGADAWVYVATAEGIEVFVLTGGNDLVPAGRIDQIGIASLAARPPLLAASAVTQGTFLFDIASPGSPVPIGNAPSVRANDAAFGDDGTLYIAATLPTGDPEDLLVFDLSEPATPQLVGSFAVPGTVRSVAFDSGLLHIGVSAPPLAAAVVTVDPHADPGSHVLGEVGFPGWPWELAVAGPRLLVASSDAGLVVIDDAPCHATGCDGSDLAAPFDVHSASDVDRFLSLFTLEAAAVDRAEPIGLLDLRDITAFVVDFLDACP